MTHNMKRLMITPVFLMLSVLGWSNHAVKGKQAHALLDGITMEERAVLDTATVIITDQLTHPTGMTLRCMVVLTERPETYVASYDTNERLIDGMLVGTKGDVNVLRSKVDNEYVWFVPDHQTKCTVRTDSVVVTRNYRFEMKPIGDTYMRHCITVTNCYAMRDDGTFEQADAICTALQIEGQLDRSGLELPATSATAVAADINLLSLNVMQLLHSPVSTYATTMEQWLEMGEFFQRRTSMTGVPDADLWSACYYRNNIHRLLTQGDGRNMIWFYQHNSEATADNMWRVMLLGYDGMIDHNAPASWLFQLLSDAAKRLPDKKARQWWKKQL